MTAKKGQDSGSVGEVIRKFRISKKLTQKGLARLLGMHQSHLSKIERNHQKIGLEEWFRFCEVAEISVTSYLALRKKK